MRPLDGFELIEVLVLGAIAIELIALYRHAKFDQRMDNHIRDTNERLENTDQIISILDKHILTFDEHIKKVDGHMSKVDTHIERLEKEIITYSENMKRKT